MKDWPFLNIISKFGVLKLTRNMFFRSFSRPVFFVLNFFSDKFKFVAPFPLLSGDEKSIRASRAVIGPLAAFGAPAAIFVDTWSAYALLFSFKSSELFYFLRFVSSSTERFCFICILRATLGNLIYNIYKDVCSVSLQLNNHARFDCSAEKFIHATNNRKDIWIERVIIDTSRCQTT